VALCALIDPGCETRPLMGSGRRTIEPRPKAHKPADSGAVVGNGARLCSLSEYLKVSIKHRRLRGADSSGQRCGVFQALDEHGKDSCRGAGRWSGLWSETGVAATVRNNRYVPVFDKRLNSAGLTIASLHRLRRPDQPPPFRVVSHPVKGSPITYGESPSQRAVGRFPGFLH
jgi:hypothetical protein